MDNKMNLFEALAALKNNIKEWCQSKLDDKLDKKLGSDHANKVVLTDASGTITTGELKEEIKKYVYIKEEVYTKGECDGKYVRKSGDKMSGNLDMQTHGVILGNCTLKYDSTDECLNFTFN